MEYGGELGETLISLSDVIVLCRISVLPKIV